MGKPRRKKISRSSTRKGLGRFFRLLSQGIVKASPLLFLGLIGFGIFWGVRENLYADPGFLVQSLEVIPEGALDPLTLQELEKRYLNQSIFRVSLGRASETIEQDPKIRRAHITRRFPNAIRIEISERNPLIQIRLSPYGPYYSAAEDGVLLEAGSGRNRNLFLVEAFEAGVRKPEVGEAVSLPGLKEGVALAQAFWAHPLAKSETIEKLTLDDLGNTTVFLADGPQLRFGRHPMKKFHALEAVTQLLQGPDRNRILYIDLQYQDLIVRKRS